MSPSFHSVALPSTVPKTNIPWTGYSLLLSACACVCVCWGPCHFSLLQRVQGQSLAISSSSFLWSVSQNDKVTHLGGQLYYRNAYMDRKSENQSFLTVSSGYSDLYRHWLSSATNKPSQTHTHTHRPPNERAYAPTFSIHLKHSLLLADNPCHFILVNVSLVLARYMNGVPLFVFCLHMIVWNTWQTMKDYPFYGSKVCCHDKKNGCDHHKLTMGHVASMSHEPGPYLLRNKHNNASFLV